MLHRFCIQFKLSSFQLFTVILKPHSTQNHSTCCWNSRLLTRRKKRDVFSIIHSFSSTDNYPFKRRQYIFKNEQMKKALLSCCTAISFPPSCFRMFRFVLCFFFESRRYFSLQILFFGCQYQPRNVYTHLCSICYRTNTLS